MSVEPMSDPANYSALEVLRNGPRLAIRALRPEDRANFMAAVERTSDASLYRRFFGEKRHFSEQEIEHYLNVDFVTHVALVAIFEDRGEPVIAGGARYVVAGPSRAEVAFVVVDQYQGQGIGAALLRHLVMVARQGGSQTAHRRGVVGECRDAESILSEWIAGYDEA